MEVPKWIYGGIRAAIAPYGAAGTGASARTGDIQRRDVSMRRIGLFAFVILLGFQSQAATILTTGDVGLENGSPNQGGDTVLRVNPSFGVLTSLIQFDLSAFAGQTVTGNGTLTLTGHAQGAIQGGDIALHRMLHAWSESVATFANLGVTAGAQAGEDFDPLILSTLTGAVFSGQPVNFTVLASVIQAWIDNPGTNFGFILEPNTATSVGTDFLSREGGGAPTLTFTSVAAPSGVPEPATALLAISSLGMMTFLRRRRS